MKPSIIIGDENRRNFVRIERICHESYDLSQGWAVSIEQDGFSGVVSVWVDEGQLKGFIRELAECERVRSGEANLHSMSPEEFRLRIFNTHPKGDFALSYAIGQNRVVSSIQLQGGFDLDPSLLAQFLSDFEQIAIIENRYSQ